MIVSKEKLIEASKAYFKKLGYKKKNNTWLKNLDDLISGYNIQTSQWDSNIYYINVGIVLIGIDREPQTAYWKWHFQQRIDHIDKSIDEILSESNLWLEKHSGLKYLRMLAKMDYDERLPVLATLQAISFLEIE